MRLVRSLLRSRDSGIQISLLLKGSRRRRLARALPELHLPTAALRRLHLEGVGKPVAARLHDLRRFLRRLGIGLFEEKAEEGEGGT